MRSPASSTAPGLWCVVALAITGCPAPVTQPPPGSNRVADNDPPPVEPPTDPGDPPPDPADHRPARSPGDVVEQFVKITDKMCGCATRECAEGVNQEFDAWLRENESAKGSPDEQARAARLAERYSKCMMGAMTGTAVVAEKPAQAEKCGDGDACADGLTCVTYYGIAGRRGPEFKSCEIRCGKGKPACPDDQKCTIIADGPGQVCRST